MPSEAIRGNHLREQVGGHAISGHEDAVLRKARVERIQQHGQDLRTGRGSYGCGEPRVTWHSVPIRGNQMQSEHIRGNQRPSEAISPGSHGTRWKSRVIREPNPCQSPADLPRSGNQMQSEPIRANQSQSEPITCGSASLWWLASSTTLSPAAICALI
jgi:hypothetical protein